MDLVPDPDLPKIPVGFRRLWIGLHVLSTEELLSGVRDQRCPQPWESPWFCQKTGGGERGIKLMSQRTTALPLP